MNVKWVVYKDGLTCIKKIKGRSLRAQYLREEYALLLCAEPIVVRCGWGGNFIKVGSDYTRS